MLAYFTSELATKSKGFILIEGCTVEVTSKPASMGKGKGTFTFELRHPQRGIRELRCLNEGNLISWVDALKNSLREYEMECRQVDERNPQARQKRRSSINLAAAAMGNESDEEPEYMGFGGAGSDAKTRGGGSGSGRRRGGGRGRGGQ